jgi:hypothetical protein
LASDVQVMEKQKKVIFCKSFAVDLSTFFAVQNDNGFPLDSWFPYWSAQKVVVYVMMFNARKYNDKTRAVAAWT